MKQRAKTAAKPKRKPLTKVDRFWNRFFKKYPTPEDAQHEFIQRCIKAKPRCCRRRKLEIRAGMRSAKCVSCRVETWFTAGTFFAKIENFTAWLAAIMCFEQGIETNPHAFSKRVGCGGATAWEIFHRLRMVMAGQMEPANDTVDSELFALVLSRRSRETPANAHPLDEIAAARSAAIESGGVSFNEKSLDTDSVFADMSPECKIVYDSLSVEPIHTDVLVQRTGLKIGSLVGTLVELEIGGLVQKVGARYARVEAITNLRTKASTRARHGGANPRAVPTSETLPSISLKPLARNNSPEPSTDSRSSGAQTSVQDTMKAIIEHIRGRFQGVSYKYLQLYIADAWSAKVPSRWSRGQLFGACMTAEPIERSEITAYIPSLHVYIPSLPAISAGAHC